MIVEQGHSVVRLCAAIAAGALFLSGCHCLDGGYEDESSEALRMVPVAADVVVPPGAGANGGAVTHQSYTLEQDGQFTFHRSIERPVGSLGAEFTTLGRDDAKRLHLEPYSGVRVRSIERDGAAAKAGLRPDDVVTNFDGKETMSVERLEILIEEKTPGDTVSLSYVRDQKTIQASVALGSETRIVSGEGFQQRLAVLDDLNRTGLKLVELTPEARPAIIDRRVSDRGILVIDVLPGGPAFFADLRVKDLVTRVGETPVGTLDEYAKALTGMEEGDEVTFTIRRGLDEHVVEIELDDDAMDPDGFNALNLVSYSSRPEGTQFGLIFDILFDYQTNFRVKRDNGSTRNVSKSHWSTALHLISWHSTKGGKKKLLLLWFFPIAWGD